MEIKYFINSCAAGGRTRREGQPSLTDDLLTSIANASLCMDERQKQIKQTKNYNIHTISQTMWNKVCLMREKANLSALF